MEYEIEGIEEIEEIEVKCPLCINEESVYLGSLGAMNYYRCCACGITHGGNNG
jgi:ribosomal protein S27E